MSETRAPVRRALQQATEAVHLRLHGHELFAQLAAGAITLEQYCALLLRLLGFHDPLDAALDQAAGRFPLLASLIVAKSGWLREDLSDLRATIPDALPRLDPRHLPALDTEAAVLGCLYVREGSTLGGRLLARALDRLLEPGEAAGRRFFTGTPSCADRWRQLLTHFEEFQPQTEAITLAATQTFATFEAWMDMGAGWR